MSFCSGLPSYIFNISFHSYDSNTFDVFIQGWDFVLFVFLSFFITGNHLMSQDTWCGFDDISVKEYYHNHPEESDKIKNQHQFFLNN